MDLKPDNISNHTPAPSGPASKISALAIVAMVLAVIPCCPPVNLLAVGLGMLAYRRIGRSGGRLRGANVARAAIFAGFALSILSLILLGRFGEQYQQRLKDDMLTDLQVVMQAAIDQQVGVVQSKWSPNAPVVPSDEAILQFGAELEARYGAIERIIIVSQTHSGVSKQRIQAALIFQCTRGEYNGSVEVELAFLPMELIPDIRLHWLMLEDPEAGNLRLPEVDDPPDTRKNSEP
ncbi:MAG: DUF4190 domain-containing protein [Planctomycetota bacterium]|nr:DUF4190 domain-containing protein [Planctomycetota bacterium]